MARDDFRQRVKSELALRVNYRCSNPDCRAPTSGPKLDQGGSTSVGVAAHITAAAARGPRFDAALRVDQRASLGNGIWLCQICAKLVDDDEARFTGALLRHWKQIAEAEARENLGKPSSGTASILESIHGRLQRESNPRFGFSFMHPSVWDRQDPANADGNIYRHPEDFRIEIRAWGSYAVLVSDLHSWVEQTIKYLKVTPGFQLLTDVPSGLQVVDWVDNGKDGFTQIRQQVEGRRIAYVSEVDQEPFTSTQTFVQLDDTQICLLCRAPSASYRRYEDLFLIISKELRVLGAHAAPFARTGDQNCH